VVIAMVAVGSGATPDYLRIRDYSILPISTAKKKVRVTALRVRVGVTTRRGWGKTRNRQETEDTVPSFLGFAIWHAYCKDEIKHKSSLTY
jgi:hypothetical protein